MATVSEVLRHAMRRAHVDDYANAYFDDISVLQAYLERVYGETNARLVTGCVGHVADILETVLELVPALGFPYLSGLDPRNPETAEWAKFALQRLVEIHPDYFMALGRFDDPHGAVWRFRLNGVPLEYVKALDVKRLGDKLPTDEIIRAYTDGLSPEYAHEVIYGAAA